MNYYSIIGNTYLYPIKDLLNKLKEIQHGLNEVQTSPLESAYSCSVITLTVNLLETHLVSASIRLDKKAFDKVMWKDVYKELGLNENDKNLLTELYVVRDAIIHNHAWGLETFWNKEGNLKLKDRVRLKGGDKKAKNITIADNTITKINNFNLIPTKINKKDVAVFLKKSIEVLNKIESLNPKKNICSISSQYFDRENRVKWSSIHDFIDDFLEIY